MVQARDISELADVVESHRVDLAYDEPLRLCGHRTRLAYSVVVVVVVSMTSRSASAATAPGEPT